MNIVVLSDDVSCATNPCDNGGRCQESVNTILCICPPATAGGRCSVLSKYNIFCCSQQVDVPGSASQKIVDQSAVVWKWK